MARRKRDGRMERRAAYGTRKPKLGYYYILTDTDKTEKNYLMGLYRSLSKECRDMIRIKVQKGKTESLVEECLENISLEEQYTDPWIVFDKDQNSDDIFNKLIFDAEKAGVKVGWSNPCIETWFSCYFGKMLGSRDSVLCCRKFKEQYERRTGSEYKKSDDDIYRKLNKIGDESRAIEIATQQIEHFESVGITSPSEMCPATKLHELIDEIREKTGIK